MHFGIGGERGVTAAECSSQQYTAAAAASNCEGSKWVDGAKERERERESAGGLKTLLLPMTGQAYAIHKSLLMEMQ